MPRGRMLSKKISKDEAVAGLSIKSALLYTWCIPHLDVEGRMEADPEIVKGVVIPYRKDFTYKIILTCLEEMAASGLVVYYGKEHKYMQFKGFRNHQTIDKSKEARSDIPSPEKLQSNSCVTPPEVKLSLSKDKISNTTMGNGKAEEVFEEWNKKATTLPCKVLNQTRRDKINSRLKETAFINNYPKIFELVEASDFLTGRKPSKEHPNFKGGLDWVITNDHNYIKILEGKYDNKAVSEIERFLK